MVDMDVTPQATWTRCTTLDALNAIPEETEEDRQQDAGDEHQQLHAGKSHTTLHPREASTSNGEATESAKRQRVGHECEKCRRVFTEKRSLDRHQRTLADCTDISTRVKRYNCTYCSKRFARDDVRKRHEKERHLGQKRSTAHHPDTSQLYQHPVPGGSDTGERTSELETPAAQSTDCLKSNDNFLSRAEADASQTSTLQHDDQQTGLGMLPTDTAIITMPYLSIQSSGMESSTAVDQHPDGSSMSLATYAHDSGVEMTCATTTSSSSQSSLQDAAPSTFDTTAETHFDDAASMKSAFTISSVKARMTLPFRPLSSASLMRKGASRRPAGDRPLPPCPLCQKGLGDTITEIRSHIGLHLAELNGEHVCTVCEVGFVHRADLQHHQQCAAKGQCGFEFEHVFECTGHHPPDDSAGFLSDNDRINICYQLRKWEQSQLRAFVRRLNELSLPETEPLANDSWSIGMLLQGRCSFSTLGSYRTLQSAPDHAGYQSPRRQSPGGRFGNSLAKRLSASFEGADEKLIKAAYEGDLRRAKSLLRRGVNVNVVILRRSPQMPFPPPFAGESVQQGEDFIHTTPLVAAIRGGNPDVLQLLLSRGADVDLMVAASEFFTPICTAVAVNNYQAVKALIERGANLNASGSIHSPRAICCAARSGNLQMVNFLLEHGAYVNASERKRAYDSPLEFAITGGHNLVVSRLLDAGAYVPRCYQQSLYELCGR